MYHDFVVSLTKKRHQKGPHLMNVKMTYFPQSFVNLSAENYVNSNECCFLQENISILNKPSYTAHNILPIARYLH